MSSLVETRRAMLQKLTADLLYRDARVLKDAGGMSETQPRQRGNESVDDLLEKMLAHAEALYGPRDKSWKFAGITFGPENPMTWYPAGDHKSIGIKLGQDTLTDARQKVYTLAHECVHLLSPTGKTRDSKVIEEGLATVFAEDWAARHLERPLFAAGAYVEPTAYVRELLSLAPDAIPRLREVQPCFSLMTVQTFESAGVDVSADLIISLLAPFFECGR